MYIKLYQINPQRDVQRVRFASYRLLQEIQGDDPIDCRIYDLVWEGELDTADLEDVFMILNNDVPEDFTARALSVSDIVEVVEGVVDMSSVGCFYYCDSAGWEPVSFDHENAGKRKAAPAATGTARK